jgi:hypothetical protein
MNPWLSGSVIPYGLYVANSAIWPDLRYVSRSTVYFLSVKKLATGGKRTAQTSNKVKIMKELMEIIAA